MSKIVEFKRPELPVEDNWEEAMIAEGEAMLADIEEQHKDDPEWERLMAYADSLEAEFDKFSLEEIMEETPAVKETEEKVVKGVRALSRGISPVK